MKGIARVSSSGAVRGRGVNVRAAKTHRKVRKFGTNLVAVKYFGEVVTFIDLMKHASIWVTSQPSFNADMPVAQNADGYMTNLESGQQVISYILSKAACGIAHLNSSGNYLYLDYEGNATYGTDFWLESQGGSVTIINNDTVNKRVTLSVTFGTGDSQYLLIRQVGIDTGDILRNVRLIPQRYDALYQKGETFTPEFLEAHRRFGTLRFMDWCETNDSEIATWADRQTITARCYGGGSWSFAKPHAKWAHVPFEVQIALCNKLGADYWTCIPHLAADTTTFATNLATLVQSSLGKGLNFILERTNEDWNGIFDQTQHAYDQGQILYPPASWPGLGIPNEYYAGWAYSAHAARLSLDAARLVFTNAGEGSRFFATYCWQKVANSVVFNFILDWESLDASIDYWCIAPYTGGYRLGQEPQATTTPEGPNTKTTVNMTSVEIHDALMPQYYSDRTTYYEPLKAELDSRSITLGYYESGQHLVGVGAVVNNTTITDLFVACNRLPQMRATYEEYYDDLHDLSPNAVTMVFTNFYNPNKYGSWGAKENAAQDSVDAPKWLGIMDHIRNRLAT